MSIVRVLALLDLLQDRGWVTGREIAERLEAEPRTVRRDLALLTELGLPVESRRGRHGGYRLTPGHRMPPLMLNDDEAAAIVVALATAHRQGLAAEAPALGRALTKIRRVLPLALRSQVEALEDALGLGRGHDAADPPAGVDGAEPAAAVLFRLSEAIRHHRRIDVVYARAGSPVRRRALDPYGLVIRGRRWYLSALDVERTELRTYRVDRITSVDLGARTAPPPDGFNPVDAVNDSLARVPWRWEVVVEIAAPEDEVRARLPAWLAVLTNTGNGATTATMRAENLEGTARILGGLGLPFVVIAPGELRPILASHARQLLTAVDPPS